MKSTFYLLFLTMFLLISACESDAPVIYTGTGENSLFTKEANKNKKQFNPELLTFDYSIDKTSLFLDKKIFNLKCGLYNGNKDTLYFFTQSCFGWKHTFIFDTTKIQIWDMIACNISLPIIKKVAPKSSFEFTASFIVKNRKSKDIQVQYYIHQVNSNSDITNYDSIKKLKPTVIKNVLTKDARE